jgi:type II secretory pathway pseudopilin PulG
MKISGCKGQTLLEVLIAISILVVTLVTTIALIVASIKAGRESTNKLIGTSLAREAVEVVRNIRDGNWASTATLDWDSGLASGTDTTFTPVITPADSLSTLNMNPTPDAFTDTAYTLIKQSGHEYVQGPSVTGTATQFFRLVYLDSICQDSNGMEVIIDVGDDGDCSTVGSGYTKVGIRVVAEVRWPSADSTKHVTIEDRLYNWQVL